MVRLDIKSHVKLLMFLLEISTLKSPNRLLRYISTVCCYCWLFFYFVFTYTGVRAHFTAVGIAAKVETIYELLPGFVIGIKLFLYYPNRKRLEDLLNAFDDLELSAEGWTIILLYVKKFTRYFRALVQMILLTGVWAAVSGLVFNEFIFEKQRLPFIDTTGATLKDWRYWVTTIQQDTYIAYGVCVSMLMDGYPALIMALICGYLEVIAVKVKKIGWMKDQKASREELVKCIDMHQRTYELQQEFSKLCSKPMMVQSAISTTTICAVMVKLSLDSPLESLGMYVRNVLLMLTILIEISIFNYMGSLLVLSNHSLKNALFDTNWVEKDMKFRKMLIMFQQRVQKFITIRIGYIFVVHLGMVASICNTAYKLYAVLMKVNQ